MLMIEQWAMLINSERIRIVKKRANILGEGRAREESPEGEEGTARYPGGNQQ